MGFCVCASDVMKEENENFDDLQNPQDNQRKQPSKRRILQDPVTIEQQGDEEYQIKSPSKPAKKGWFGRLSTSSGEFDSSGAIEKDNVAQRTGGLLPSSKGAAQSNLGLNQDPFQPGST